MERLEQAEQARQYLLKLTLRAGKTFNAPNVPAVLQNNKY
jgi:hypothetical protein